MKKLRKIPVSRKNRGWVVAYEGENESQTDTIRVSSSNPCLSCHSNPHSSPLSVTYGPAAAATAPGVSASVSANQRGGVDAQVLVGEAAGAYVKVSYDPTGPPVAVQQDSSAVPDIFEILDALQAKAKAKGY